MSTNRIASLPSTKIHALDSAIVVQIKEPALYFLQDHQLGLAILVQIKKLAASYQGVFIHMLAHVFVLAIVVQLKERAASCQKRFSYIY